MATQIKPETRHAVDYASYNCPTMVTKLKLIFLSSLTMSNWKQGEFNLEIVGIQDVSWLERR